MATKHFKNQVWTFTPSATGGIQTWEQAQVALLMDIRDELKLMNKVLQCHNTAAIPHTLARIDRRLKEHMPLRKKT